MRRVLVVALAFWWSAGAQQVEPPALRTIRESPSYRQAVKATYQRYESGLAKPCLEIELDPATNRVRVFGELKTDAQGDIVEGHWKDTTAGTACGVKKIYNASVTIHEGKPLVLPLFPGSSFAGPQLQTDSVGFAVQGSGLGSDCKPEVMDTATDGDVPPPPKQPWVERWTLRGCGKYVVVMMHFTPDATGTQVTVNLKETVPAR